MAETTVDNKLINGGVLKAALTEVKGKVESMISDAAPGVATAAKPGLMKPGAGLQADADGTVKVVLNDIEVDPGNIAKATKTAAGVVQIGTGIDVANGVISVDHTPTLNSAKKYTDDKIADLVGGAPETLDTLKEIADALGEDANLSATLTTEIGKKADKNYVDGNFVKTSSLVYMTDAEATAMVDSIFG